MATARNWLKTLWPASYKGTPFFVEKDDEGGGRRIVIHQFPMRDDPYNDVLGEDKREFTVTAYLASDSADSDASSLSATCVTRGAGVLVLPAHGPLTVRCLTFGRSREKDRAGYIAFSLKFVREGAATALISISSLANLGFVAVDDLASAAAASFAATVLTQDQPDFVVQAVTTGVQDAAAMLDTIRTTQPVDPTVSAQQRDAIQALYDDAATVTRAADPDGSLVDQLFTSTRALGDAMPAANAMTAFLPILDQAVVVSAPGSLTPSAQISADNLAAAYLATRLAALAAYADAVLRMTFADRPAGLTARADVAEYFGAELDGLTPDDAALFLAIQGTQAAVIAYLSTVILNLAPVITVAANLSMPSLFWAWRLYADPTRSAEIVARNKLPHPSFVSPSFEALAR